MPPVNRRSTTPTVNKILLTLLVAFSLSISALAQQCVDSDRTTANAGNNPLVRGSVTVTSSTGSKIRHWDTCDAAGRSLRELICTSSGTLSSVVHQGTFGCLDGAIIRETDATPACFTDILLAITPGATSSTPATLSVLKATREIDRLWWATARSRPQHNDSTLEVIIRNAAGETIATRYSSIVPEFFDIPATRAISRVTLPYLPTARSILFKTEGAQLVYTLPSQLLICSRPRVPVGLSGIEGIQWCVPEGRKLPINPTTFTCIPGALPSPSAKDRKIDRFFVSS